MKIKIRNIAYAFIFSVLAFIVSPCSNCILDFEKKLVYYPINKTIYNLRIKAQEMFFYSKDGVKLNALYSEAQKNKPTIIYCHGQGENIYMWQDVFEFLMKEGYGVFLVEYRGHGKSKGSPYESGLYRDLESAVLFLNNKGISNNNIILWGRSLGGAVVADIASRENFKGVILDSTFTNLREAGKNITSTKIAESKAKFYSTLASAMIRLIPLTQRFQNDMKVKKIKEPTLIVHSLNDTTVPYYMGVKLAKKMPNAKIYLSNKGSHHSSNWSFKRVEKFLKEI